MAIKDQKHTENYSLYNGDCMEIITQLKDNSIDLSTYSPPFAGLFQYSSDPRDMSNCSSPEQFLQQYDFLIEQIARITKSGRISAVHCMDICDNRGYLWDFPHEIIELHKKHGFEYRSRITIWKEPLKVRMRTMVQSLMHKFIVEDSSKCFPAVPDYLLVFTMRGDNEIPIEHISGMNEYAGEIPIMPHMLRAYNNANDTNFNESELWEYLKKENDNDKITKLNHYIWQRYASSMWDDIRIDNVLPFREAKEEDDEKHIHPLQLDVIERVVELWSNPNEVVFTPFMGVGSEVYGALKKDRKAIGIELKTSYFRQSCRNIDELYKTQGQTQAEQLKF